MNDVRFTTIAITEAYDLFGSRRDGGVKVTIPPIRPEDEPLMVEASEAASWI
jgi:hypothetical protein